MYKALLEEIVAEEEEAEQTAAKSLITDNSSARAEPVVEGNYLPDSLPGCLVVRKDTPWILDYYDFSLEELGFESDHFDGGDLELPDFLVDPETYVLTVINPDEFCKTFYLSVDCGALGRDGISLPDGPYFDGTTWKRCRTFVVVLEPKKCVDVCVLEGMTYNGMFESDIQPLHIHPDPWTFSDIVFQFPFQDDSFLCTQAVNGSITHYFSASFHAVDFQAPVGTNLLAIADGIIKEIIQDNTVSGIRTSHLFQWNGITLQTDDGLLVEYVHIDTNSATVQVGDRVKAGDVICKSGSIGFSPEPHLHLEVHRLEDPIGPDVYYAFRAPNGETFFPVAGQRYNSNGLVNESKI